MDMDKLFDEINTEFAGRLLEAQIYQAAGEHLEGVQHQNRERQIEQEKERAWAANNGFTVKDVIEEFVKGRYLRASGNVWSGEHGVDGLPTLWSYETPIGIRLTHNTIAMNPNKYSITTRRHQSWLKKTMEDRDYKPVGKTHQIGSVGMYDHQDQDAFTVYARVIYDLTHEQEAELMEKYERARLYWEEQKEAYASEMAEDVGYASLKLREGWIEASHDRMERILAMIGGKIPYDKGV